MTTKEIKLIRSLSTKKGRKQEGLFVVEGEKIVKEALASDFQVISVYRTDEIGLETMSRISALASPSPSLAVVKIPENTVVSSPQRGISIALDSVRDPGNLGTIIRTADWFGVRTIYLSPDCAELYNPKTIQSSMGSIFRMNVIEASLPETIDSFRKNGFSVAGTFLEGEDIYRTDLPSDALVIMGNEANGISRDVSELVSLRLTIPQSLQGGAESLNVATATAITLSEFFRKCRK